MTVEVYRPDETVSAHAEANLRPSRGVVDIAQRSWPYLLIFALMLSLPRRWFIVGTLIMGSDEFPFDFLNPQRWLTEAPYVWNFLPNNVGGNSFGGLNFIIIDVPSMALSAFEEYILRLPTWFAQQLWFSVVYIAIGLSFLYMLRNVFYFNRFAALAGTLFYCLNFYVEFMVHDEVQSCFLVFTPLLTITLYSFLTSERRNSIRLLLFCLVSIVSSRGFANPVLYIVMWLTVLGLVLIGLAMRRDVSSRLSITRALVAAGLALVCNLWWLIEAVFVSFLPGRPAITVPLIPIDFAWVMANDSLTKLTTLSSPWYWPSYFGSYTKLYEAFPFALLMFVPALVAWLSVPLWLIRRGRLPFALALVSVANLVLLFLAKGLHSPLGELNNWLYLHVPGFFIFRDSDTNFIPVLLVGLSIQTSFAFTALGEYCRRKAGNNKVRLTSQILLILAYLATLLAVNFPMITGELFQRDLGNIPILTNKARIPGNWFEAAKYINSRLTRVDGAVLVLPIDTTQYVDYGWFYGVDTLPGSLINAPVITPMAQHQGYWMNGSGQIQYEQLLEQDLSQGKQLPGSFYSTLGIRFVVVRTAVSSRGTATGPEGTELLKRVEGQQGLSRVASFGDIIIFQTTVDHGRVYLGDQSGVAAAAGQTETPPAAAVALTPRPDAMTVDSPNPTIYHVHLPTLTSPAWLVLNDVYHPDWVLVPGGGLEAWLHLVPAAIGPGMGRHVVANGFANGWDLPAGSGGDFTLLFWPQAIVYMGWLVSAGTVVLLSILAVRSLVSSERELVPGNGQAA